MPIKIGARKHADFTNPLELLTDCHRRIEHFLNLLITVNNQARGAELDSEQRHALETALRYFRRAAPKHTMDEEDSLFPRLRSAPHPLPSKVFGLLQTLCAEHDVADQQHQQIESLVGRWISQGTLSATDSIRLTETLNDLAGFYARHIAVEEGEVFPLAAIMLGSDEIERLGSEMAERRGVDMKAVREATL